MAERGVLYVATGSDFVNEAITAARIMKENAGSPATIVSDEPVDDGPFEESIVLNDPEFGFSDKIVGMQRSPYDTTLYLDTDTYVTGSLDPIFDGLDQFDLAAAHNNGPQSRDTYEIESIPKTFPEINTGVLGYRMTDEVQTFFREWNNYYQEHASEHPHDQPSFRKKLYESNIRFLTLPQEYNCLFRYPGHAIGPVRIFHGRLQEVEGPGAGKYHNIETAVNRINSTTANRVFTQIGGISVYTNSQHSLLGRFRLNVRRHGIVDTAQKAATHVYRNFRGKL